jgi:hypothetical protein
MGKQARDALATEKLTVLADRGYFKGEEILDCEQSGIHTLVSRPQTSGVFRLPAMSNESPLHDWRLSAHLPLGARICSGGHALSLVKGCSTVRLRKRMAWGVRLSRFCLDKNRRSSSGVFQLPSYAS